MARPLPVVFIGPMASGKSKVGRRVAAGLEAPFFDTDKVVAREHGAIRDIFERQGEPAFRLLERQAVAHALSQPAVVSLGGGAVLHPDTRSDLREASVVLLTVSPEAVAKRIGGGGRPLLADGGIEAWQRIYAEREPIYRELADVSFDTSTRPLGEIVDDVIAWVKGTA
ncbi:shikimate kinase [Rathayibacter sp. YIM 133350]|uniref:shikimate kinase n=1 Tax=Rathayibacter sp. YIM 133350 TaxID=3131992 RepID=UPI00307EDBB5